MSEIRLGIEVKDKLTDLKGTTIAKVEYLFGCIQYLILPRELKDGKPIDDLWIDEAQLENTEEIKKSYNVAREEEKMEDMEDNIYEEDEHAHGGMRTHPK